MQTKRKYKNKRTTRVVNGKIVEFDSMLEAKRYDYLYLMARAKKIRNLVLQKSFTVMEGFRVGAKKVRAITYTPDFIYERLEKEKWILYVDDAKGMLTEPTKIRQKLFLKEFGKEYKTINSKLERKVWIEKEF